VTAVQSLSAWWDAAESGALNMALDEMLAERAATHDAPMVRFYRWHSPTVSLGAFQAVADARAERAFAALPLVRRASGGGAIVHGSDLTYALALPRRHPWCDSPRRLYEAVHAPLVEALAALGVKARLHAGAASGDALLCFSRRAPGDVVLEDLGPDAPERLDPGGDGGKILGGAQRRLAGAVLQHGSLLLTGNPEVDPSVRHPGLGDLAAMPTLDARGLADEWIDRIAQSMGQTAVWEDGPFAAESRDETDRRMARFAEDRWLNRR
jgi:lipoate-protein ligase A